MRQSLSVGTVLFAWSTVHEYHYTTHAKKAKEREEVVEGELYSVHAHVHMAIKLMP